MIQAVVGWAGGGSERIYAATWPELFERMGEYGRYVSLEAREIAPHEIRQGRCRSEGSTEGRYCQQF